MRFLHLYLIAYFLLLVGAAVSLWQSGVLARTSPLWVLVSLIITIGLGVLLAVTSRHPA